ncbi:hypothetical protein IFM89_013361 [Coptis chinensis]|uniref:Protein ENHANCED DISEASE RESISTANCE 2 C-terminal domain-containing protein n=1 Tax=Coptis chinensis TaxID=261450 RepID=A0A835I2W6_9MAGN|nr:hypothetical protein IFM89_013361 [Coptis chinensis]
MGVCVSRPEGCVGKRQKKKHKSGEKRKRGIRRKKVSSSVQKTQITATSAADIDRSFNNPTFQGSTEEAWFDSIAVFESDCEDDYQSVPDDAASLNGLEGASVSSLSSSVRDSNHGESNDNVPCIPSSERRSNVGQGNSAHNSVSEGVKISNTRVFHSSDADVQSKSDGLLNGAKRPVSLDEVSSDSVTEIAERESGVLENCGILPNNCLPCLASTVPSLEKRRSLSPGPPSTRKKAALKLSFKWREGQTNSSLSSTRMVLQRPIAGSQVPFCPLEKKMFDCWSSIDPSTFKVRGEYYLRQATLDKKKEPATNFSAYYPFGVDVFLSPRKIKHIAQFVDLPVITPFGKLPTILVVNVQIPLYPATIFQNEFDGEGMSFVLYFRLSENYSKELAPHFLENLRRIIDDEVEKVKNFPVDTILPVRDRLKILGRVANVDDLGLSAPERKLMHAYNEKPVLSRPQHEFYLGENYLEIDIDMHRFGYISRKGFEVFHDKLKLCVLDVGLTIQGNKAEELPEQVLCSIRLNGIDYMNYHQLGLRQDTV